MLGSSNHISSSKILQIITQSPFKGPQNLFFFFFGPLLAPAPSSPTLSFFAFNVPATLNGLWLSRYTMVISCSPLCLHTFGSICFACPSIEVYWFTLTELNSIFTSLSPHQTMRALREESGSFQGPHLVENPGPEKLVSKLW